MDGWKKINVSVPDKVIFYSSISLWYLMMNCHLITFFKRNFVWEKELNANNIILWLKKNNHMFNYKTSSAEFKWRDWGLKYKTFAMILWLNSKLFCILRCLAYTYYEMNVYFLDSFTLRSCWWTLKYLYLDTWCWTFNWLFCLYNFPKTCQWIR